MRKPILTILATLLLLSSCGFTLRGTESPLLSEIQQLQLSFNNNNNELGQILRRRLIASGLNLVDNIDNIESTSTYTLFLGEEVINERVVSVNRNVRAGEYELNLTVSFRLENNGKTTITTEIISLDQIYEADPSNPAAKTNEAELVLNELRQALVDQIIRRLENVN